jgi:hypothetical protein
MKCYHLFARISDLGTQPRKRIFFILICLMAVTVFAGCKKDKPQTNPEQQNIGW